MIDIIFINSNINGKAYATLSTLYTALIGSLDGNQSTYCTVTGSAVTDMTGGATIAACRAYIIKADGSTLDYILYSAGGKIVCTGRITSDSTVINIHSLPTRDEMDAVSTFTNFSQQVTWQDATPNTSYNNFLCFGKICVILFDFTSPSTVTSDKVIATLPTGFRANGRNVGTLAKAWSKDSTAIIHITGVNITLAATAWEANTRYVGQVVYIC